MSFFQRDNSVKHAKFWLGVQFPLKSAVPIIFLARSEKVQSFVRNLSFKTRHLKAYIKRLIAPN